MRRIYLQFYLTIIASLVLVVLAAGLMWRLAASASPAQSAFDFAGELATAVLPDAAEPKEVQQAALDKFARTLKTDIALYSPDRTLIAAAGRPLGPPRDWRESGGWMHVPGGGHAWAISLPDGRWVVMRAPHRPPPRHPALGLIVFLGAIALAVALGAYPIVRRLTARLERLEQGVVSLGAGDLATRVPVEGRDEVAALAQSFNRAAERIEALVSSHKMLLANASHELRTPLSRLRLGIELLHQGPDAAREAALARDIAELDALIDEILLSSRLDAVATLDVVEEIDLLGLVAEECAHYPEATLDGQPAMIEGDSKLVRRLVRNLLQNAERHGTPPIEVMVTHADGNAVLTVTDHGPGVPASEREKIFEPFRRIPGRDGASGTGLGLALVRQIAQRHGGTARCDAGTGPGSSFRVVLPLSGGRAPNGTDKLG